MPTPVIGPIARILRLGMAVVIAFAWAGSTAAQDTTPGLAAPAGFPGAATLPKAPVDTRLPGPNPRHCGSTRWSALCAEGRWSKFSRMQVALKAPGFAGEYSMEQPENNDVHTTYREQAGATRRGGEVIFVNEEAFAYRSRDRFHSPETMLDELMSTPILVTQLAALLLDQGALVGPDEITKPLAIRARNSTQFLRTEAPSVAALFGPPWEMTGLVAPDPEGGLTFRLRLTHRPVDAKGRLLTGKRETVELNGTVHYGERRKAMSETFDLVGWKLVFRNSEMDPVSTLGEARQAVGPR